MLLCHLPGSCATCWHGKKEPEELGADFLPANFCQLMGLITLEAGTTFQWAHAGMLLVWGGNPLEEPKSSCVGRGWMESPGVIADIPLCGCVFVALGLSPFPVS